MLDLFFLKCSQIQFEKNCWRHPRCSQQTITVLQLPAPAFQFSGLTFPGAVADSLLTTISIKMFPSVKLWVGITKG